MGADVSIIICTRDHAQSLRRTLAAMCSVRLPTDLDVELLVIDNAPSDDAVRDEVAAAQIHGVAVRYVCEPTPGQCHARNTGIRASTGRVILFTDDDVVPPPDWIEGMCRPILDGRADAVAGGVAIPPHLQRPWMTGEQRAWLASTDGLAHEPNWRMVGANMAFSRDVLAKVPLFDCELGPGALGFGDETLLSHQIVEAGFKVAKALDVQVEHHFEPSRLCRAAFLSIAARMGRSSAYIDHHWRHYHRSIPRIRWAKHLGQLWLLRGLRYLSGRWDRTVPETWELHLVREIATFDQAAREQRRPRNYPRATTVINPQVAAANQAVLQ